MSKIFIFRHGQTTDNRDDIFSGWRDVDLTPEGIQEAKEIAKKLESESPTRAFASDLIRSRHTLDIVLQGHKKTPVTIDARIKERNYGDLSGTSKIELKAKDPVDFARWHRSYDVPPPHGESIQDVEKRVFAFLADLKKLLQPEDSVFISAHGNSIRPMRKFFENLSNEQMCSYEYQPATVFSYIISLSSS